MKMANDVRGRAALRLTPDDVLLQAGAESAFAELGSVAVGHGPIADLVVDPGSSILAATNYRDNTVALIDADDLTTGPATDIGGEPAGAAVADGRVYVVTTSASYDSIAVVNTQDHAVVATHPLDLSVTGIAVPRDGGRIFVGRTGRGGTDIAVIDGATGLVDTVDLATGTGVVVDVVRVQADGRRLYAAASDAFGSDLLVIDTEAARVLAAVAIGSPIRDIAVSPEGSRAYVLVCDHRRGGSLHAIDTKSGRMSTTVEIGGHPTQLTLSPDGTRAYIVDSDAVLVVCTVTGAIVGTITVGAEPSCVATSPDGVRLYVADYAGVVTAVAVAPAKTVPLFNAMALEMPTMPEILELEPAV